MSSHAIERLRLRFIFASMMAIFLVMMFIGSMINISIYFVSEHEIRWSLGQLVNSLGEIEDTEEPVDHSLPSILRLFTPTYQRNDYYVLIYDESGDEPVMHTNRGSERFSRSARESAEAIGQLRADYGRYGVFYYQRGTTESGHVVLAMIDGTGVVYTRMRLMYISVAIASAGLIVTFFLVRMFSGQVVETEIENTRRQEQFITNASHELKTPLAVIRANTEMQEMLGGENEWTQSTIRQVDRMDGLIQNLVQIAKAREQEERGEVTRVDVTAAVRDSVTPFEALAKKEGKTLEQSLGDGVTLMTSDSGRIRQLTSLLVDNAIKYCDEGGKIRVSLENVRKGIRLTVSNDYREGENIDCDRFFDRFYREDQSHNADRGGYGIGLSIAESICEQSGGSIRAEWKDGVISFICLLSSKTNS